MTIVADMHGLVLFTMREQDKISKSKAEMMLKSGYSMEEIADVFNAKIDDVEKLIG